MQINPIHSPLGSVDPSQSVVPLEQRVRDGVQPGEPGDDFEALYHQLLVDLRQGLPAGQTLREYLRDYGGEGGSRPYNDSQKQVDVLTAVLQRMEQDDLKGDPCYSQLQSGLVSAAMMNMLLTEFRSDVFDTNKDDDSEEDSSW
ncbi:hypothetical protein PS865_04450 [Pseudomonas fluorescens]|uniref:hypothetical protein n=1 Tax=Pseudomonas fluorescens TaxID=294 RepID=UPI001240A99E|nr:hypothetical protein [Pseudomonas fluorescens]VVP32790.1 hypothetical protein PS865_04450 [Pseudomonas fluorescens]